MSSINEEETRARSLCVVRCDAADETERAYFSNRLLFDRFPRDGRIADSTHSFLTRRRLLERYVLLKWKEKKDRPWHILHLPSIKHHQNQNEKLASNSHSYFQPDTLHISITSIPRLFLSSRNKNLVVAIIIVLAARSSWKLDIGCHEYRSFATTADQRVGNESCFQNVLAKCRIGMRLQGIFQWLVGCQFS
jgi:hypothetical protein